MTVSKPLVCPEIGTLINGCEVLGGVDANNRVPLKCGRCGKEFRSLKSTVVHRRVKSCGCYIKQVHNLVMREAFYFSSPVYKKADSE